MFHPSELDFTYFIQQIRSPLLDSFFKFLNYFDRQEFFILLIPAVWFGIHWKVGVRLFYVLIFNSLANHFLKALFAHARPFHLDSNVGVIEVPGYGFPSGAAQTTILLSGLLLLYWKNPWKWPIAFLYFSLISFSRLYLGVHFISDILGGWIFGFGLFLLFAALRPLEKYLEKLKAHSLLILGLMIPTLVFILKPSSLSASIAAIGASVGLYISYSKKLFPAYTEKLKERFFRVGIAIAGTLTCFAIPALFFSKMPTLDLVISFFLFGLWLGLFGNLICFYLLPAKEQSKEV